MAELNQLLQWLTGGDLRSDGQSNRVVELVLGNPDLFGELLQGLDATDDTVRGRAADALEKVARSRPDLLRGHLPDLIAKAETDPVAMVRWHLAMILGHLLPSGEGGEPIVGALLDLLADPSAFVRSWAIAGLCIAAREYPDRSPEILARVQPLQHDTSTAIRTRAREAVRLLRDPDRPFPKGWRKRSAL